MFWEGADSAEILLVIYFPVHCGICFTVYMICRIKGRNKSIDKRSYDHSGFRMQRAFDNWFSRNSYVSCHSSCVFVFFFVLFFFFLIHVIVLRSCLLAAEQYVFPSADIL